MWLRLIYNLLESKKSIEAQFLVMFYCYYYYYFKIMVENTGFGFRWKQHCLESSSAMWSSVTFNKLFKLSETPVFLF